VGSKELFEYSQLVRSRFLEKLAALPWEEVTKSRGASFDSLRNVMLHTIDVEGWLFNVIIGQPKQWVSRNPDEFHDLDSIRKSASEVESKVKAYLSSLTPAELERKVEFPRRHSEAPPLKIRVDDILVHGAVENIYHFGELIALLWQMDVEPPFMGWIAYLQSKQPPNAP
jgi:uncharacterized damage-inducible protein DinB